MLSNQKFAFDLKTTTCGAEQVKSVAVWINNVVPAAVTTLFKSANVLQNEDMEYMVGTDFVILLRFYCKCANKYGFQWCFISLQRG